jgi:hypothetical protein
MTPIYTYIPPHTQTESLSPISKKMRGDDAREGGWSMGLGYGGVELGRRMGYQGQGAQGGSGQGAT